MPELPSSREDCPEFTRILDLVSAQNPLQKKRIEAFLRRQGPEYWRFAEDLSRALHRSFIRSDEDRREAAASYNRLCADYVREQIRFRKTGKYPVEEARQAFDEVYGRSEVMRYYMVGLLLTYLFWPNHYEMLRFFRESLEGRAVERYLEVGCGHGLFTAEAMGRFPEAGVHIVDLSETSLQLAQEVLEAFRLDPGRIRWVLGDFLAAPIEGGPFDRIVLGEVVEHVRDARGFLLRARDLLAPGGAIYLSTCANCPAIDHIYHFHNAREIRDLILRAGLSIDRELALPAEDVPEDRWERELIAINYCSTLTA